MDLIINNLRIFVENDGIAEYIKAASVRLKIREEDIRHLKTLAKTLDTADKDQFFYNLTIAVSTPDCFENTDAYPLFTERVKFKNSAVQSKERPIIIGFGPAGIFAALELLDHGLKPIIFERGKKIEERTADVDKFVNEKILDPESNIQFGEGGAGSYSDGKLFSRINNSEYIHRILDTLIKFGAPQEIAYVGKPHLGTDVIRRIVRNIRNYIIESGGEIHYSSKMTDVIIADGAVKGVVINGVAEYPATSVYLAIGHSSRDTFEMIRKKGVAVEQKPISVGVRIEHPAEVINQIRYGDKYRDNAAIGAATYSFNHNDKKTGRGVNTFCMCPGGEVVNAASEKGLSVVNGMSYSKRAGAFSNSALVVTCHTGDYGSADPLGGIEFQKEIERRAHSAAGGTWLVPAQNLEDFLSGKATRSLNSNSCAIGAAAADVRAFLPSFITGALKAAFTAWKADYPLFVSPCATLLGAETRTSAPIRITRTPQFESINIKNLFPIGEGSGYTGGIMSSATDAIKAVESNMSRAKTKQALAALV